MTFTPHDWQQADQGTLERNNYTSLLAIEPGGGKTAASLLAHRNSGADVTLVVAPQGTHRNAWIPEAEKILGVEARVIGNTGKKALKEAMTDFKLGYPGIYLVTPQLLTRADTEDWMADLIVVDEGHYLNRPNSKGQKAMQSLTDKSGGRLFLSGTPWRNNFERAWSVMRFLWPERYTRGEVAHDNFYIWQRDRMTYEEIYTNRRDQWGQAVKVKKWLNEAEPGRLLSEAPCAIIHKKREECCEFHTIERQGYAGFLNLEEPQVIRHTIELTRKQKQAIEELQDTYVAWLEDNPLVVDLPITMQQRIRQITLGEPEVEGYTVTSTEGEEEVKQRLWFADDCKSPFTDHLLDLLEEDEEPIVVYLESQTFAEVLVKKLTKAGFPAFEFSGKTTKTRDADLQQFGTKYRVAVIVISAGGTGLDGLQKTSKTEVWLERSVDETNNIQARSRQDRLGGVGQVQRHIFLDDLGYAEGKYSEALEQQIALNATLRKAK